MTTAALFIPGPPPIELNDTCDQCGFRAYVRATLPSGLVLTFCHHHGSAKEAALMEKGANIERAKIPA